MADGSWRKVTGIRKRKEFLRYVVSARIAQDGSVLGGLTLSGGPTEASEPGRALSLWQNILH